MLPFNTEFQTGVSKITKITLNVVLTDETALTLTEQHVLLGGLTRDTSTTVDGEFTIGAAVTGKLTVIIDNSTDTFSGYNFRDAVITAYIGGVLSDETTQMVKIGIYTVDEYTYDGSNITLTAYDNLYKFDIPCKNTEALIPFPRTIAQLVEQACISARVVLLNESIPNGAFVVEKEPAAWETMTWHDVISYCAQIACCFAKIDPDGKLYLGWYDTAFFMGGQLDGGTFGTQTTPYHDGAIADGGDFTYSETTTFDGGHFGDRDEVHYLSQLFNLSVDTDDIQITGVNVLLSPSDNIEDVEEAVDYEAMQGTDGYRILIQNNPLIETIANADALAYYIYDMIGGMRFRSLNSAILENPSAEAGDCALVIDRSDNTYTCFLSHVTYTTCASTSISCDAASAMQNLKARYGEQTKTKAIAERALVKAMTSTDDALKEIVGGYATTMGLRQFPVTDAYGNTIYIYGNGTTLANSQIQWKFTAGAFMVSSNYGVTWNAAISSEGIAVFQAVYAVKVIADNIVSGDLVLGGVEGNKDGSFTIKDANGNILVNLDKNGGTIKGSAISLGGRSNGNGSISIYDSNGILCGNINNTGMESKGNYLTYSDNYHALTKMTSGRLYAYYLHDDRTYTYEQLKNLAWNDAAVMLSTGYTTEAINTGWQQNTFYGGILVSPKNFIALGNLTGQNTYISRLWATDGTMGFKVASNPPNYKFATVYIPGDFYVRGSKNRIVETEHYGDVLMNAFETPNAHFADIGSGVVGSDGMVLIYIDSVFGETIDEKQEYQVLLTRTSEEETSWVDKRIGYFVVHGEPGATFDWMIIFRQKEYSDERMEAFSEPAPFDNSGPLEEEDTTAIDTVTAMVDQFNAELEELLA